MHPIGKHAIRTNAVTDYAADMNAIMAMYKCRDDWNDDRKLLRKMIADVLGMKTGKIRTSYEEKTSVIVSAMKEMDEIEKAGTPEPGTMNGRNTCALSEITSAGPFITWMRMRMFYPT